MPIDVHPDVYIYNIGSTVLSKTLCIKINRKKCNVPFRECVYSFIWKAWDARVNSLETMTSSVWYTNGSMWFSKKDMWCNKNVWYLAIET